MRQATRPDRLLVFFAVLAAHVYAGDARAIPAFARAYEVPCTTCHTVIPRRNEFGEVFRANGFHWPDRDLDVDARAQDPPPQDMIGQSLLLGRLPFHVPIALVGTMAATVSTAPDAAQRFSVGAPSLSILAGGSIGRHVSFFGAWSGRGVPNELYLHFARVLAGRPELNVRVGRFEPTTTLFRSNDALLGSFLITSSAPTGYSLAQGQNGVELNGAAFGRIFWASGVVVDGDVAPVASSYVHARAKVGGMDWLGVEPDIDLENPNFFDEIVLTLGTYAVVGQVAGPAEPSADARRAGVDARLRFMDLTLGGGVMAGFDRDRLADVENPSLTATVEVAYAVSSWLLPVYQYQYQDAASLKRQVQTHDVGVLILLLENVRARAMFTYSDNQLDDEAVELQILFGA